MPKPVKESSPAEHLDQIQGIKKPKGMRPKTDAEMSADDHYEHVSTGRRPLTPIDPADGEDAGLDEPADHLNDIQGRN